MSEVLTFDAMGSASADPANRASRKAGETLVYNILIRRFWYESG